MNTKQNRNTDFHAFVRRQQPVPPEGEPVDWAKERDNWLRHLDELYDQIQSFLADYFKTREIELDYREISLNEENIGSYRARQMIIKIGRQEITMTPIGTLLIGAKGRVDVAGSAGRTRLVLVSSEAFGPTAKITISIARKPEPSAFEDARKEIHWVWKIATNPPVIRYIELTQESFSQMLMEVANG